MGAIQNKRRHRLNPEKTRKIATIKLDILRERAVMDGGPARKKQKVDQLEFPDSGKIAGQGIVPEELSETEVSDDGDEEEEETAGDDNLAAIRSMLQRLVDDAENDEDLPGVEEQPAQEEIRRTPVQQVSFTSLSPLIFARVFTPPKYCLFNRFASIDLSSNSVIYSISPQVAGIAIGSRA